MSLRSRGLRNSNQRVARLPAVGYDLKVVKRLAQNLALLCALLPQCLLATIAPALVMCQEADGGQVLELALSDCCDAPAVEAETEGLSVREQGEGCEGCTDSAVPFSLKRDDGQGPVFSTAFFPQESPAWNWSACAPPQRLVVSEPSPNRTLQALRTVNIRC